LGCVGFMISAGFAIVLPGTPNTKAITLSVVFTLLGAIGFLVGSLPMLPEAGAAIVAVRCYEEVSVKG
jgi:hypothetical protein